MIHLCSIDGCTRPRRKREWCNTHYEAWRRHGDPTYKRENRLCSINGCRQKHHARGLCSRHSRRFYDHGDPERERPRWLTDMPTYAGAHHRIRSERGPASRYRCVDCGDHAQEWSYDGADPNEVTTEWRGKTVRYSLDLGHYHPRCVPCHRAHDGMASRARRGESTTRTHSPLTTVEWPIPAGT